MALTLPWRKRERKVEAEQEREVKGVLGLTDELGAFLIFGDENNAGTPGSALALFEKSTAVSVPINLIGNPFSVIDPVLLADREIVRDHPVLDLLKRPSPYFTQEHFLEMLAKNFLITGEAVVVALGAVNKPPLELQPISPGVVSVVEGDGGIARSILVSGNTLSGTYEWNRMGAVVRYFDGALRELKLIRNWSTKRNSMLRGMSPLVSASQEARQHILGTQHNASLLQNGGRVTLVFHYKQHMSHDDFKETVERVRSQYGGSKRAGSILVTAGDDLDVKEAGVTNKDMDFANLQLLAQKSVALQYGVPLPLITNERQTFNNYARAELALWDNAIIPLAKRLFGGLGDLLLPRFGEDPARMKITLDPDGITALVERRNEELLKRKQIGIETDNELRAQMGREPYDGGDVILKPANLIPAGSDLFTADNRPELVEDPEAN